MRILVLTSSTGGGHDSRAYALESWVKLIRPEWVVYVHKALEETHSLYRFGVGLYNFIQRTYPPLHHIYYNFLELAGLLSRGNSILGKTKFIALLENFRPDVVFSVHNSTNHGFFHLAKQVLGHSNVKCVTYCSEMHGGYGMSRYWVNPQADLVIGSLPETVDAVKSLGMPANKLKLGGFLLHPSFYVPLKPSILQNILEKEFQLALGQFTIILSTGANSANHHMCFLKHLSKLQMQLQIIALCGDDHKTRQRILEYATSLPPNITVRALPRTNQIAALMQGSHVIVGRPGAGISHEALHMERPLIINKLHGLMPQELVNEKFAVKNNICFAVKKPEQLNEYISNWLESPKMYEQSQQRIRKIKPVQRPADILACLESL